MTTLTPEEEAEFTLVNALAFDYYRVAARAEGSIVPCWLCLSERARDDARRQLTVHLRASNPLYLPRIRFTCAWNWRGSSGSSTRRGYGD